MYLKSNWRVLTIGDGDLTFTLSLAKYHQLQALSASVLDSQSTLTSKYEINGANELKQLGIDTYYELDITSNKTWPETLKHQFDLIIFQFPLVPSAKNKQEFKQRNNQNLVNRQLLRHYLSACFEYFLDPLGQRLSYITSKEVKPYSHWQIETDLTYKTNINYIGKQEFKYLLFPEYQIRNVDRDKQVKDTKGFIYCYSDATLHADLVSQFLPFTFLKPEYCPLCRVGPFQSDLDKQNHLNSSKHKKLAHYQNEWFGYIDKSINVS